MLGNIIIKKLNDFDKYLLLELVYERPGMFVDTEGKEGISAKKLLRLKLFKLISKNVYEPTKLGIKIAKYLTI